MNIFVTSLDPVQSALWLDDKRVNKMITESAQMLSTVLRRHGYSSDEIYKSAYERHPCTLWTGRTSGNFSWLVDHALGLCAIYRCLQYRDHGAARVVRCADINRGIIPAGPLQEFEDCTEFKDRTDLTVIERYRLFMNLKWNTRDKSPPVWRKRELPPWKD